MTILIVGDAIHHLFVIQNQLGILKQQLIKIKLLKKTKRLIGIHPMSAKVHKLVPNPFSIITW